MKKNLLALMFILVFIGGVSVMSICSATTVTVVDSDSDGEGDKGNGDLPKQELGEKNTQDIGDVEPFMTVTRVSGCPVILVSSDSDEENNSDGTSNPKQMNSDEKESGLTIEGSKSEEKVTSLDDTNDDVPKKKRRRKRSIKNTAGTEQNDDDDVASIYDDQRKPEQKSHMKPKQKKSVETEAALVPKDSENKNEDEEKSSDGTGDEISESKQSGSDGNEAVLESEGSKCEGAAKSPDGTGDGTSEKKQDDSEKNGYVSMSEAEPASASETESEFGSESELDQIPKLMRLKQKDDTRVRDVSFWEKFKARVFPISDEHKGYIHRNGLDEYLMTYQKSFYDEIRSCHIDKMVQYSVLDIITYLSLSEKFERRTPEQGRYLDSYPPSEFLQIYYGAFYEEYVSTICSMGVYEFKWKVDDVIDKIFGLPGCIARIYVDRLDGPIGAKHMSFKIASRRKR